MLQLNDMVIKKLTGKSTSVFDKSVELEIKISKQYLQSYRYKVLHKISF